MAEFMEVGGLAPTMLGVVWMFQVIAFILVGLRLYTRLVVIHSYGWDDHFFNIAVFFQLVYIILITVATRYGLGQHVTDFASPQMTKALLLVNIGQTVIFIGVITVKISIACFLLRIVGTFTAKQLAIVIPVSVMSVVVFVSAFVLWFSCTPISFIWDISVPGGTCNINQQAGASLASGISVIFVELWYASYPWYLIRGLQMPKREKILIGTSMSVGYISAACSISRLFHMVKIVQIPDANDFLGEYPEPSSTLYLTDVFAPMAVYIVEQLIWNAADHTTQLLCIGITVCRPLYKDWLYRVADHLEGPYDTADTTQGSGYGAQKGSDAVALRSIGGGILNSASTDRSGRKRGRPKYASKKPGAALRRDLVLQSNNVLTNNNTEFAALPPIETRPRFGKALFPWATSREN